MGLLTSFERVNMSSTLVVTTSLVALLTYVVVYAFFPRKLPQNAPPIAIGNYPLLGAVRFWTDRWDFIKDARRRSPTGNFSFYAGSNLVVGLSGQKGRRLFYETRELKLEEGYAVLFGQAPDIKSHDDPSTQEDAQSTHNRFTRHLLHFLKTDYFRKKLPILVADVHAEMEALKNDPRGVTDPFESIYCLVFRLTIRLAGADDMAEDTQLADKVLRSFNMIEQSAGATTVMFPNTPTIASLKRTYGGGRLYMLVEKIVKQREAGGERRDDAVQFLMDEGERTFKIIEFIVGALFAGLLNSGINAAWMLCCLACSPEWLTKAREEVRLVVAKYASNPNAPLRQQLDDLPFEAFETEFPVMDMCLRDSIRLNQMMAQFRRNVSSKPIPIGTGEVIPPGAFVAYHTGDVHMDPEVYPDPEKWDPSRYSPGAAQDKSTVHGFVGWGSGRHPCLGMRFAKLEQNIITAYFLAYFDFHLEDKYRNKVLTPPKIDFNQHGPCKPKVQHFLKLTRREE